MNDQHFIIHTDGGARGNPGPAAVGVVAAADGRVVARLSQTIGQTTNNQAEYQAVHLALTYARDHGAKTVDLYADSELIVKQLRGEFKIKNKDLAPWFVKIQALVNAIGRVHFFAVPREENMAADALVNEALDRLALVE